jgi:hypothetical protein
MNNSTRPIPMRHTNMMRYLDYKDRLREYALRMPNEYLQLQLWRDYQRKLTVKRGKA